MPGPGALGIGDWRSGRCRCGRWARSRRIRRSSRVPDDVCLGRGLVNNLRMRRVSYYVQSIVAFMALALLVEPSSTGWLVRRFLGVKMFLLGSSEEAKRKHRHLQNLLSADM